MRFLVRNAIPGVAMAAMLISGIASCSEDCDREYQACLNRIGGNVAQFTYEETCKYPSMNRGDEKRFCDCEAQRDDCMK